MEPKDKVEILMDAIELGIDALITKDRKEDGDTYNFIVGLLGKCKKSLGYIQKPILLRAIDEEKIANYESCIKTKIDIQAEKNASKVKHILTEVAFQIKSIHFVFGLDAADRLIRTIMLDGNLPVEDRKHFRESFNGKAVDEAILYIFDEVGNVRQ